MKLWLVNDEDWYAALSAEDAERKYREDTAGFDTDENVEVEAVDDDELDRRKFREEDGLPERTFRQHLAYLIEQGETFPCPFASRSP